MIPLSYYNESKLMIHPEFGQPYEDVVLRTTVCEEHPIHMHDCVEIIYVLRGRYECKMSFEQYEIREGEFMVFNAFELHRLCAIEPDSILSCIHVSKKMLPVSEGFIVWWGDILKSNKQNFNRQAANLSLLIEQYENRADSTLVSDTLERIIRMFRTRFRIVGFLMTDTHDTVEASEIDLDRANDIYMYMYRHCNEKMTLDDLSDHFALSKYYFAHFMKRMTGGSFQQFLNAARCDRAEIALLDSSRPIEEIRLDFGFSSNQYFSTCFKKLFGMSPGIYRRTWQKFTILNRAFAERPVEDASALFRCTGVRPQEETIVELHIKGTAGRLTLVEYLNGEETVTGYERTGEERIRIDCGTEEGVLIIKKQ